MCPLQLTGKAVQVHWASFIQKPPWLNLGCMDGLSAVLVQMPMHVSPGDVFYPFHCPGNCEQGGGFQVRNYQHRSEHLLEQPCGCVQVERGDVGTGNMLWHFDGKGGSSSLEHCPVFLVNIFVNLKS